MERYVLLEDSILLISFLLRFDFILNEVPLKIPARDHQPRLDAWDKRSDLVHWEDLEGSGGERGGRGDRDGEHM